MPVVFNPADAPGVYNLSKVYDPATDTLESEGKVIPAVGSIIIDGVTMYLVTSVDPVTYESTLSNPYVSVKDPVSADQRSYIDYGNNTFYLYIDNRNTPIRCVVDSKLVIFGAPRVYNIVRYPDTVNEEIISADYNPDGSIRDNNLDMQVINDTNGNPTNMSFCVPGHLTQTVNEGERLRIDVYNEDGVTVSQVYLFVRRNEIVNESIGYKPIITGVEFDATQQDPDGTIYLYVGQNTERLNIGVYLVYDDGVRRLVTIDGVKAILDGVDELVSAYPGLHQKVLFRYAPADEEVTTLPVDKYIRAYADIEVRANPSISVSPYIATLVYWSTSTSKYALRHILYTSDRDVAIDVTSMVTYESEVSFNGVLYNEYQTLIMNLDLNEALPDIFTAVNTIHRQSVTIRVSPQSVVERYFIRDTPNSATVYGVDAPTQRRPVLFYDTGLEQYYVPSSIFPDVDKFLDAFWKPLQGPYDSTLEAAPPTPTHFQVRDLLTGAMLTATPQPIANYEAAFSILTAPANGLVNSTVRIDFLHEVDANTTLTLVGVPVDVYELGSYQG